MQKFIIYLDQELKTEMAQYEVDWSEICSEAIRLKINSLNNNQNDLNNENDLTQLIDIDIDSTTSSKMSQSKTKIPDLPKQLYDTFREVWKDFYHWDCGNKPPTSKQIKKLWKLWYEPSLYQEEGRYLNKRNNFSERNSLSENAQEQLELFEQFAEQWGYGRCTGFGEFITKFVYEGELLNITELNPFEFTSVTIEEKDDLPPNSGIYFVIDTDTIYYIGMSKNLRNRWYNHHKEKALEDYPNLRISYIDSLPVHYLESIETTFIEHFTPRLNIKKNPLFKQIK